MKIFVFYFSDDPKIFTHTVHYHWLLVKPASKVNLKSYQHTRIQNTTFAGDHLWQEDL